MRGGRLQEVVATTGLTVCAFIFIILYPKQVHGIILN